MIRQENGDPGGSRTPNPQIRSLMLYPIELRGLNNLRAYLPGVVPHRRSKRSERFLLA